MNARAVLFRVAGYALLVFASACGDQPTGPARSPGPSPIPGPPPGPAEPVETTFTVTNGWTGQPVAGATVSANGAQVVTNAAGQIRLMKGDGCVTVEIVASGFLERRTCATSEITLWPISDAAERAATRLFFVKDEIRKDWRHLPTAVMFALELRTRDDVVDTWTAAADEIDVLTARRFSFEFVETIPEYLLVIAPATLPPVCSLAPPWPIDTGGFCVQYTSAYYVDNINVPPDRLTYESIARRALLSVGTWLQPHSAPGLLNKDRPDHQLSEFERKTLHMIGLRKGVDVQWPDFDIKETTGGQP